MAWINPKTNWTGNNDERFNIDPDYLRIKGNIEYLADLCTKYYRNPNGETPYFHIAYADSADGKDGFYVGGGRNLIHDTSFKQGLWSTAWNNPSMSITADGNLKFIIPDVNQAGIGVPADTLEMDKIYTLTAKVRGHGEFQPYIMYSDNYNFSLYNDLGATYPMIDSATEFVEIKYTFTPSNRDTTKQSVFAVLTSGTMGNWLEIKKDSLKLEAGNVATPWSPAPSEAHPTYMGTYTDYTQADSLDPTAYKWTEIKGDTGEIGPKGADGRSSYIHIKHAPVINPTDSQITDTPNAYIGVYTDYNQADSTSASAYTWSKWQGGVAGVYTNWEQGKHIIPLQTADLTTIPYVSFFNNITADIDLIADVIGRTADNEDMRVIYENQPIWDYNDLNIIESNTLWEYNKIVPQYQVSRKVPFEQCGLGGIF